MERELSYVVSIAKGCVYETQDLGALGSLDMSRTLRMTDLAVDEQVT